MEKNRKLSFIRKATPFLYVLAIGLGCVYVGVRACQWTRLDRKSVV